jgi:hypothetical protein
MLLEDNGDANLVVVLLPVVENADVKTMFPPRRAKLFIIVADNATPTTRTTGDDTFISLA